MTLYIIKFVLSALIVVIVSEVSKRTGLLGALIASLPLVSILSIIWIYLETRDVAKIREFSVSVCWLVAPSIGFFVALPLCLQRFDFWVSLSIAMVFTIALYAGFLWLAFRFGLKVA